MTHEQTLILKEIIQKLDILQKSQVYAAPHNVMSESNFQDLIDSYRQQACSCVVEDFLTAFLACEFHSDELLFGLADAFKKRGQYEVAKYLDGAAQLVPPPGIA